MSYPLPNEEILNIILNATLGFKPDEIYVANNCGEKINDFLTTDFKENSKKLKKLIIIFDPLFDFNIKPDIIESFELERFIISDEYKLLKNDFYEIHISYGFVLQFQKYNKLIESIEDKYYNFMYKMLYYTLSHNTKKMIVKNYFHFDNYENSLAKIFSKKDIIEKINFIY